MNWETSWSCVSIKGATLCRHLEYWFQRGLYLEQLQLGSPFWELVFRDDNGHSKGSQWSFSFCYKGFLVYCYKVLGHVYDSFLTPRCRQVLWMSPSFLATWSQYGLHKNGLVETGCHSGWSQLGSPLGDWCAVAAVAPLHVSCGSIQGLLGVGSTCSCFFVSFGDGFYLVCGHI